MSRAILSAALLGAAIAALAGAASAQEGKAVYDVQCAVCHATGLAGAPRRGNAADWGPRLKAGRAPLYRSAMQGTPRGMPARGGNPQLSDDALRGAVDYLLADAVPAAAAKSIPPPPAAAKSTPTPPAGAPAPARPAATATLAQAPAQPAASPPAPASLPQAPSEPGNGAAASNAFNRLLKPMGKRNVSPMEDGIHDTTAEGTPQLQSPATALGGMPHSNAGNRIDWVKSLEQKRIAPRWERDKPDAAAAVMDLNIVREVKGSMPDVVYPHKQHTEWLDCANCHPAIFLPQKGANPMSMASILLGQGCGTCHGRVAFPVSECRLCHSRKKDGAQQASRGAPATEQK